MSTESTLMNMSQEVLLMIFIQFFTAAKINFESGVALGLTIDQYHPQTYWDQFNMERHYAPNMMSWVPQEYIAPMLICKYLRPIVWEAFLEETLFVFSGRRMGWRTPRRRHSWWDMKLAKDPTDLARRVQSDLSFAHMFGSYWCTSKNLLPNLKELSITGIINVSLQYISSDLSDLGSIEVLRHECSEKRVRFNAYIAFINHRSQGSRKYAQTVRLIIRENGPILIKEVRATEKTFYDALKQDINERFEQELKGMECKRGRKLIRYIDNELDWQEGS